MMEAAPAKGGRNLLNLKARNEAIELTRLKGLVAPPDARPQWAHFALALLATHRKPSPAVDERTRINPFLQTWETTTRKTPSTLKRILKVAKKYNVKLATGDLSTEAKRQLPIWFHIGATNELNKLNNHFYAPCLRDNHGVITVDHLMKFTSLHATHQKWASCTCDDCVNARNNLSCAKPFKCFQLAANLLKCLPPQWNPGNTLQYPTMTTTTDERREALHKREKILFDPSATTSPPIENAFSVFSSIGSYPPEPAHRGPPPPDRTHKEVIAITCGEYRIDDDGDIVAGGGARLTNENEQDLSLKVEEHLATRNSGEILVITKLVKCTPKHHTLNLIAKTEQLVKDLTIDLQKWDHIGWLEHEDAEIMKPLVAALRERSAPTYLARWSSSTSKTDKEAATTLAKQGIIKDHADKADMTIKPEFNFNGLRIAHGTQCLFYKGIL
ncbi:hypothetical protein PAXINDRAFT_17028 [Paxillus involutus ATCC 200175]|uniref:Uncharacterized protein n=1 Tax=Paxillus involutus ATCC 200175 TaxID=664439 RepID=A0A0C9TQ53_PAXIN|nr:hypothetical protein PAXINDRAFT_17028 [Paxillus involutus ATCC 200175]